MYLYMSNKGVRERIEVVGSLPTKLPPIFSCCKLARRAHLPLQRLNMPSTSFPVSLTVRTWKCNPVLASRTLAKVWEGFGEVFLP